MTALFRFAVNFLVIAALAFPQGKALAQIGSGTRGKISSSQAPSAYNCSLQADIPLSECLALVALYNSTNGPHWTKQNGWLANNTPGSWYGVTVDQDHKTVTALNLSNNSLSGQLPPELSSLVHLATLDLSSNQITGPLPAQLGSLANLVTLDLNSNPINSPIPTQLGNLTNLNALILNHSQLTGSIPADLGNLGNLVNLDLGTNQLSGSIPTKLGNLTNLENLDLDANQLGGVIPSELGLLSNLGVLNLSFNQFSGPIPPELSSLAKLAGLDLSSNQLSSAIPPELGSLANLASLDLSSNLLDGSIPGALENLTCLLYLNLSTNQLSGSIPSGLGNLVTLLYLGLNNNRLSGNVPQTFTLLINLPDGWGLNLGYNQLNTPASSPTLAAFLASKDPDWEATQTIPFTTCAAVNEVPLEECEALVALYNNSNGSDWAIHTNWLENNRPSTWFGLSVNSGHITQLFLQNNNLSGSLPGELGNLGSLVSLKLGQNHLEGPVPGQFGNLANLVFLDLKQNALTGSIPASLGNLSHLSQLDLAENQLSGEIPSGLGNLTQLQSLDLSGNQLMGWIPDNFGNLLSLNTLFLNNNQLAGDVPVTFTQLTGLYDSWGLSLDYNHLNLPALTSELAAFLSDKNPGWETTQIPLPFTSCTVVTVVPQNECEALLALFTNTHGNDWLNHTNWLQNDQVSTWYGVTVEGGHLSSLVLNTNGLNGSLPSQLQDLTNLNTLSLADNMLAGQIPSDLGSLTYLTSLNLSGNQLDGLIPPELGNLFFLTQLNLAHNQLSGDVPVTLTLLENLYDGWGLDLGYNHLNTLASTPELAAFLNLKDPDWASTQVPLPTFCDTVAEIPHAECEALSALFGHTGGTTWTNHTGWLESTSLDAWYGVTVNSGHVIALSLSQDGLTGLLPAAIGNLTFLESLDLGDNQLSGLIPIEMGNLINLRILYLNNNQFNGDVPVTITQLVNLYPPGDPKGLDLDHNHLNTPASPPELAAFLAQKDPTWEITQTPGTLRGRVNDSYGNPLPDITVSLETPGFTESTCTAADGEYAFQTRFDIAYQVQAVPEGANLCGGPVNFATQYWKNAQNRASATSITANILNPIKTGIDFSLQPGGGIAGHVYHAPGGMSLAGVCIDVSTSSSSWNPVAHWAQTGADGSFSFYGVLAGQVYIRTDAGCSGQNVNIIDAWYAAGGSTPDAGQASAVTVSAGQVTPGIDFQLEEGGSISGSVTSVDTVPLSNARIRIRSVTGAQTWEFTSASDGSFTANSLPAGQYIASASADGYETEYFNNSLSADTAEIIPVLVAEDSPGIDFSLAVPGPPPEAECQALVDFYTTLAGSGWTNQAGWLGPANACSWYGIACHDGHMVKIALPDNNLVGSLNDGLHDLTGLPGLQFLDLGNNHLNGSIPLEIGSLTHLSWLAIDQNHIGGEIPPVLGNLVTLRVLRLEENQLSGAVPPELVNLIHLKDVGDFTPTEGGLGLDYNRLTVPAIPADLAGFLALKDPDWEVTQSISITLSELGAVLTSRDGSVQVSFPPGAAPSGTTITFIPQAAPQEDLHRMSFAGQDFLILATDGSGHPLTGFDQPVTVMVHYTAADTAGLDEAYLFLFDWDALTGDWVDAATTCKPHSTYTRNPAENWLSVEICHLTEFSLMEPPDNNLPNLAAIDPGSVTAGSPGFTLSLTGSGFMPTSLVTWGATILEPDYLDSAHLTVSIPAGLVASAGTPAITVTNPAPGGGPSNTLTFTINNPVPYLVAIDPSGVTAGSAGFTLTVSGVNFVPTSLIHWNNLDLDTTFGDSSHLSAVVDPVLVASAGVVSISVSNPLPGGGPSNAQVFTVSNPTPELSAIDPATKVAGDPGFTLNLTGTGFVSTSQVRWNGTALESHRVDAAHLLAVVSEDLIATPGIITIDVFNPEPGGGSSTPLSLTIIIPTYGLTAIDPSHVTAGSPTFTLNLTGTGFVSNLVARWNATDLETHLIDSTHLTASVPASLVLAAGTASIAVFSPDPGGGLSNARLFIIENPLPGLTSLDPFSMTAGSLDFTINLAGANFVSTSQVLWDSTELVTHFVDATRLTADIPAALLQFAGTISITVFSPQPGGGTSSAQIFTVNNPAPGLVSLDPLSVIAGSPGFTINLAGANFVSTSQVLWDSTPLDTHFVNTAHLTADVPSARVQFAGTISITVSSPQPGGGTSSAQIFTVNNPAPGLVSLDPLSVIAGSPGFTINLAGANFVSTSQVLWDSTPLDTHFVDAAHLAADVPAARVQFAGTISITVSNPQPGGGTTASQTFTINNPTPGLASLDPLSATAGRPGFSMNLVGANFVTTSQVLWNSIPLDTHFVDAAHLTADIPASLLQSAGTVSFTIFNPPPSGGTSAAQTFTVNNPTPGLSSLDPLSATAGSPGFTLILVGTNYVSTSQVKWGATDLVSHFVDTSHLTADVPATLVQSARTVSITIFNPPPGGGTSAAQTFTVNNPAPSLASLDPLSVTAGSPGFSINLVGANFVTTSQVFWDSIPLDTHFVDTAHLTADVPATLLQSSGTVIITVSSPQPGGGTTSAQIFTVNNPAPGLVSLDPLSVTTGSPGFTLNLVGTNFVSTSQVKWVAIDLVTHFIDSTHLTADVPAVLLQSAGTISITVFNPQPAGGISDGITFTVSNPPPVLTGISPENITVRSPAFILTVTGSGFIPGSRVLWNGADLTTTYVSTTQLTALVPASYLVQICSVTITVNTPSPGGGSSLDQAFTIAPATLYLPYLSYQSNP